MGKKLEKQIKVDNVIEETLDYVGNFVYEDNDYNRRKFSINSLRVGAIGALLFINTQVTLSHLSCKNPRTIWVICLALFIVIISCNSKSTSSEKKGIRTEEEAMYCMDIYIDSIRNLSAYADIMQELSSYLLKDSIILYAYGMNNAVKTTIDSAILFNDSLTFCCCLLIVQTPKNTRNDYIDKFNGVKVNNQWIFSEDMHSSYKRQQDSLGNYVPYTLDYLSTNVRMEFIKDGFIKNKDCEIDWKYVDKWR